MTEATLSEYHELLRPTLTPPKELGDSGTIKAAELADIVASMQPAGPQKNDR